MEMRDLKADLELCNKFAKLLRDENRSLEELVSQTMQQDLSEFMKSTLVSHALRGWPHAIERAIKAEILVQELVGAIDELLRQINECGFDDEMWDAYQEAKEVLGDE